jgi:hypothetical protein
VPNTVPTLHMESLFAVASVPLRGCRKPLEISNGKESRATLVPTAKLLILRAFTIRNQQVSGSSPEGGSRNHGTLGN